MKRTVVIGFSKPKNKKVPLFSWAIRLIEGTPFSHAYIKTFSATADEWVIYQASGVQVNFMGIKFFEKHAQPMHEFSIQITEEAFKSYLQFAMQNAGAPYDIKSVFGLGLKKILKLKTVPFDNGDNTNYCSRLAAHALGDFFGVSMTENEMDQAGLKELFDLCSRLYVLGTMTRIDTPSLQK